LDQSVVVLTHWPLSSLPVIALASVEPVYCQVL